LRIKWLRFLILKILLQKNKSKKTANKHQKKQTKDAETDPVGNLFLKQKPFSSLLSTVTWFLEQESVSNLAMNLDVNYCQVNQNNFKKKGETGKTMEEMIFIQDGDSFQNSPIDLIFYEKKILSHDVHPPDVASMSSCKLRPDRFKQYTDEDIDNSAYNYELLVCMKNMTAQFVTKNEYQKLLFILGFKDYNSNLMSQDYKEILTLFNDFNTATESNFKDMLKQLQFPFVYDEHIDLAGNQRNFKDFFLFD
jgi:hypothetical protein